MTSHDKSASLVAVYNKDDAHNSLIGVNMSSITKLTSVNYLTWRLQVRALLEGHELHSFIDDPSSVPPATITTNGLVQPNPALAPWKRQDRLLYSALIGSLSLSVQSVVARAVSSRDIWTTLERTYGTPSRGHIKQIKQHLKRSFKGTQSVTEYMRGVISKADQLALLLGTPMDHEDILDIIVEGLGDEYRAIVEMVNGRDVPISIEELHDKLLNRENTLALLSQATLDLPATANAAQFRNQPQRGGFRGGNSSGRGGFRPSKPYLGKCQICSTQGHSARRCPQLGGYSPSPSTYSPASPPWPHSPSPSPPHWQTPAPPQQWQAQAHYTTSTPSEQAPWLLDSGASHHIASNLSNLSIQSQYNGGDDVLIGDGSGLKITHTGSTSLPSSTRPLVLSDVLCVPAIKKNLISVNKLCKANNVMVQLCPSNFQVKDLQSGATMVQGRADGGLYEWPATSSFLSASSSFPISVFFYSQVHFVRVAFSFRTSINSHSQTNCFSF